MKTKLLYLLLFICSYSYAQFPTNGLVAQYGFDNGSFADGANGNNFTQTGTALTTVNDRFNTANAISLNGDYLTASNVTTGTKLSVSFWVKTSTTGTKVILNDADGITSSLAGYEIYVQNGVLKVRFGMNHSCYPSLDQSKIATSSKNIADGNWHHVVVTLEYKVFPSSGNVQALLCYIYMDNLPGHQGTNGIAGLPASCNVTQNIDTAGNLTLANDRGQTLGNGNRYVDTIDDILIYNRILTTAERQSIAIYNGYCFTPQASLFSAIGASNTTAIVSIGGSGVFDIAYHKTSETFSNATIITGVNAGNTTLTGLDESTLYDVYIREQCASSGTNTGWSQSNDFRTLGKIFVNANATGANDGSSWADAYTDLQDALAVSQDDGQEIWIATGRYTPHTSNRGIYYVISKQNMGIYGGFDGTESQLSDRVVGTNETILSGDLQNNDDNETDFLGNYSESTRNTDNSYRIINITATGNNLVLDGLTISDAHNNASATSRGAAIIKEKTVPYLTIKNCVIKDNVGRNDNAGLIAEYELTTATNGTGALVVENCKFINNMSRWGSALYCFVRANNNVNITVANTLFDGNIAGDLNNTSASGLAGSASWIRVLSNGSNVDLNLSNNTYVNNQDLGTAQSLNNFSRATVAISRQSGITGTFNAQVNNCIFWNNTTGGGATTRSITDLYKDPVSSLVVRNSIDPLNFNDNSISSTVSTLTGDPLFTNEANNDYTLTGSSPAIDTGNNTYVIGSTDLLGNQRIFNTTVDMGVYEFDGVIPCTVTIPDVNFKNYLVGNTAINTNGDTEIQCSEATAFAGTINVNNGNISDLTGIEVFTSLAELSCANNQLASLDLSANTALTILNCNNNQLTSIDVSNSTALTELRCDTNQLSTLDISNNTALTSLVYFSNLLTSLNVISNTVLTTLDCSYNSLTSLNVSANTALTTLTCRTNPLTSLDVTTNTALTFLNCFATQIPSLDVSANTALTTIFCGDNSQLTSLNVANGNNVNVVNFNTTNNPILTCIQVDDVAYSTASWTSIDAQTSFSTNCTPCTVSIPDTNFKAYLVGLTNINTNGDAEIQCSEATAFAGTINVNNGNISDLTGVEAFTSLNQLRCGGNSLTTLDVSQNTALTQLHCGYNSLSSIDVSNNLFLIILEASNNQLTNINVTVNTQLLALRVSNNLISNIDVSSNSSLVALEVYDNQLTAIDISANTNLTNLYLHNNSITSLDVSSHSALNYLDVSNNNLTSLNVANGNNTNFYDASNGGGSGNPAMDARQNSSLSCIQIDAGFTPPNSPSSSRWEKDATASYNTNCASLGVNDYELNAITIYPNPVNNTLNIELENTLVNVEVYNLQGQRLLKTKQKNFNVSSLSSGVYLLKIYSEDGTIGVKRFVKK